MRSSRPQNAGWSCRYARDWWLFKFRNSKLLVVKHCCSNILSIICLPYPALLLLSCFQQGCSSTHRLSTREAMHACFDSRDDSSRLERRFQGESEKREKDRRFSEGIIPNRNEPPVTTTSELKRKGTATKRKTTRVSLAAGPESVSANPRTSPP